jgi:hypothetical protein
MDSATVEILKHWNSLPNSALVKRPVVQALFGGISDEEVNRRVDKGLIPSPIKILGGRTNFWWVGDLRATLEALKPKA